MKLILNAYLVGGAVRDKLLGITSKDLDFVVAAKDFDQLRDFVLQIGCKIVKEKPDYLIIRAVHAKFGGVDFALPRNDFDYSGRQSSSAIASSIEADLARRDFSMNAIAQEVDFGEDWEFGQIIDPFNGIDDIKNKLIKFVGDPALRIREDELRVLRGLRFALTKGFTIENKSLQAIKSTTISNQISSDRIFDELNKMFRISNTKSIELLTMTNQLYLLNRIKLRATT